MKKKFVKSISEEDMEEIHQEKVKQEMGKFLDHYFEQKKSASKEKRSNEPTETKLTEPAPINHESITKQNKEHHEKNISSTADIPDVERVKTFIPGFDDLITKGIPEGSAVLLAGGPGTGKTTFCLNLINNAAEKGEKCLYLTFEEDILNLKRHMKSFGWDPVRLEKEGLLVFKKMEPFELSRSVEALLAKASGELTIELDEVEGVIPKGFMPDRIILDSLSAVAAAFTGKEEGYRIYIEQLFSLFKRIRTTSFLITEIEEDTKKYSKSGIEEFLADAVFVFYNMKQKSVRLNAMEILKIRGTSHQKKIVPFKILSGKGIEVYPQEEVFN